jgi:hypothetical protein
LGLSETAAGQVTGAANVPGLVAWVVQNHLLGPVWFDQAQSATFTTTIGASRTTRPY